MLGRPTSCALESSPVSTFFSTTIYNAQPERFIAAQPVQDVKSELPVNQLDPTTSA